MPIALKVPKQTNRKTRPIRPWVAGLGLIVAMVPSCITTTEHTSPTALPQAVASMPESAWSIAPVGMPADAIGWLVRFQEDGEAGRSFYSVRNLHHQELGLVDTHGRAWRFEPFEREPNWLGSGSVPEGVSRILSPGSPVVLTEMSLSGIESSL